MVLARTILVASFLVNVSSVMADDALPYKSANEKGVKTCLTQIKEVGNFITKDNAHASHDVWNKNSVDQRMFSSFVVKGYSDSDSHVSIIVGPDKTGKCFAEYNETSFWPKSCSVLREEVFPGFKFGGSMKGTTIFLENPNGAVNVYLTPQNNGNSCLITKREVIYY